MGAFMEFNPADVREGVSIGRGELILPPEFSAKRFTLGESEEFDLARGEGMPWRGVVSWDADPPISSCARLR
jgi:hypothetical protein